MAEEDLLVQVHIPKCAGTSIWYWLARTLPGEHGFLYPNVPISFYYDLPALVELGLANTALRCMSSHYFRIFPDRVAGRNMRYFTLLRGPVRQYMSFCNYVRKIYREITDPEMLASVPPEADRLTAREFTAWMIDRPDDVPFRENYQTNYLASYEWRTRTGRGPRAGAAYPKWSDPDWKAYRAERLTLAKSILRIFVMVGVVERMPESLTVLAQRAAALGLHLGPLDEVGHINATGEMPDAGEEWIGEHDAVGRRLLANLAEDRELYAFAVALLDDTLVG